LVSLIVEETDEIVNGRIVGRAYTLTQIAGRPDLGFSVVRRETGMFTFPHEIGHNLGCQHDAGHSSSRGLFPYSYGWLFVENGDTYGDLMSYAPNQTLHYSNSDISFLGVPLGSSNVADNASTIRLSAPIVSGYRSKESLRLPTIISPIATSADNNFSFTVTNLLPGLNYRVQSATNLNGWMDATNVRPASTGFRFSDSGVTNGKARLYRVVSP
jgi:hypothetical protein